MLVIPVFVPHAGCPNNCCFCNQKVISGNLREPDMGEVAAEIEKYRKAAERYQHVQIAFFGGSFTAIPAERQEMYMETASGFLRRNGGFVDEFRLSTRPDAIDGEVIKRLKKYGASFVELGAQSMDDRVLEKSGRGHRAEATEEASRLLKEAGFVLGLQTMTGLPGADDESDLATARRIAAIGPDFVRIYPTVVVRQTQLFRDYEEGRYVPATTEEAVRLCSKLCEIYAAAGIRVVRMGLQATGTITRNGEGSEIAAGPYHEAFGQLVRSYDALETVSDRLREIAENKGNIRLGYLTLEVPPGHVSDMIGQRRTNIEALQEGFGFSKVRVVTGGSGSAEAERPKAALNGAFESRLARAVKDNTCERTLYRKPGGSPDEIKVLNVTIGVEFRDEPED
ncbi:MAG: radical SAM protein [Clostridia bacterium]|nr:radical SAM protein [Clostridia bacterium]